MKSSSEVLPETSSVSLFVQALCWAFVVFPVQILKSAGIIAKSFAGLLGKALKSYWKKHQTAIVTFFAPIILAVMVCAHKLNPFRAVMAYIFILVLIAVKQVWLCFKFREYENAEPGSEYRRIYKRKSKGCEDAIFGMIYGSAFVVLAVLFLPK